MTPDTAECSVCRRGPLRPDSEWSSPAYPMLACPRCGIRRVATFPAPSEAARLYADSTYTEPVYASLPGIRARRLRGAERALRAVQNGRAGAHPPRLLDVGCSRGDLLEAAVALGWSAHGIDPDPTTAASTSARVGVPVTVGQVPGAFDDLGEFDILWMSHVLEHVADPLAVLRAARRHLAPGGVLVVRTPNADSWVARFGTRNWSWACPPLHLWYFTPTSLELAARATGFSTGNWSHARGEAHAPPLELAIILAKSVRRPRRRGAPRAGAGTIRYPMLRGATNILLQLADAAWPRGTAHGTDEIAAEFRVAPESG